MKQQPKAAPQTPADRGLLARLGRLAAVPENDGDRARPVVGTLVLHLRSAAF